MALRTKSDDEEYRRFLMEMELKKYEIDKRSQDVEEMNDTLYLMKMHELRCMYPERFKSNCTKFKEALEVLLGFCIGIIIIAVIATA